MVITVSTFTFNEWRKKNRTKETMKEGKLLRYYIVYDILAVAQFMLEIVKQENFVHWGIVLTLIQWGQKGK